MASNNDLLGSGVGKKGSKGSGTPEEFSPIWLYKKDTGVGKLVKIKAVYDSLNLDEWVNHPAKCEKQPVPEVPKPVEECTLDLLLKLNESLDGLKMDLGEFKTELENVKKQLDSLEATPVKIEPLFKDKKSSVK